MSKKEFELVLNETGCPYHDHPKDGGRVPFSYVNRYGEWLRKNDPVAFDVLYNETTLHCGI